MVTGKFNLSELYERVGYSKQLLSRGKFAEFLAADNRWVGSGCAVLFQVWVRMCRLGVVSLGCATGC